MSLDTSQTYGTPNCYIELPVNVDGTITVYELTDWGGDYYVEGPVVRGHFLDETTAERAVVEARSKWEERRTKESGGYSGYGFSVSVEPVKVQVCWSEAVVDKLVRDVVF